MMATLAPVPQPVRTIRLRFCDLDFGEWGACTRFLSDGSRYGAEPHDTPHYHALAHRLGYAGDVLAYCQEHELAHHLVAESYGSHSLVIRALAQGEKPAPMIAAAEEALAMALQRFARANEHPFVDCFPWEQARERFLELAEAARCES